MPRLSSPFLSLSRRQLHLILLYRSTNHWHRTLQNVIQTATRLWEGRPLVGLPSCFYVDRWTVSQTLNWRKLFIIGVECFCYRNAHYSPHSHTGLTTHLILKGSLTITYPQDEKPERITYGVGDRIDVDAGRQHEVWIGSEGCTYVIGEWKDVTMVEMSFFIPIPYMYTTCQIWTSRARITNGSGRTVSSRSM